MTINIKFVKAHDNPNGTVSGRLEVSDAGWTSQPFLAELNDVHPGFADHIVKAVNTHAALTKVLEAEGADGPVRAALAGSLG
ncbi:MAG: hypothetical protein GAK28_04383 [Luteibacter sp.]|uniref:hypothetical protein n=1 Tax=Luteibacter sp. TaxID=1886636 RepID=UPI00137CA13A|nr:hypothetical protein [Luteibacter sp.]KAF1003920.1 MAG: hypothetical protein GAK28_04383 [Luteibacter sp.]